MRSSDPLSSDFLPAALRFLAGGGAAARLIVDRDWSDHPLGAPANWPDAFKATLSTVLNSPESLILCWGKDKLWFFFNEAYAPLLGPRLAWAMGAPFRDVWADAWPQAKPIIDDAFTGKSQHFSNLQWRLGADHDAANRWFSFSCSRLLDASGEIAGLFIFTHETTERVLADKALAETQAALSALNGTLEQRVTDATAAMLLHQNIVQSNPGPILAFDRELRVTAFNRPHAEKFFETQGAPSYIGQRFPDYFIAEERPQITALMNRALAGETFTSRVQFGDPAHTKLYWDLTHGPLRDVDGVIVGGFHHAVEVTAQVAAESALAESQEALRHAQKMEAMGQLTGGVAHDFNNLLTPILGSLDILQRRGVGDEREQRLIGAALQSADRAKTLVQRLLAFARRQPLQPVAVDTTRLVRGMESLIASTLGPQIKLSIVAPEALPTARADFNQIEMALLNLSVNARDAMPTGGHLHIAVSEELVGLGHRSGLTPERYIRLAVIDTGIGMDEQTQARAVEPFFSTKGIGQGTGLGLSMALGLAQQLSGALTIQSALGEGTTVELWLPLSEDPVPRERAVNLHAAKQQVARTVLLVDDEELVRLSTAEMLTDLGYSVIEVGSAYEALHALSQGLQPSLIVSDHLMPGMTGADLAERLREQGGGPPILIISGYAESIGIAPDLPRLTKPFRQPELMAMLTDILDY